MEGLLSENPTNRARLRAGHQEADRGPLAISILHVDPNDSANLATASCDVSLGLALSHARRLALGDFADERGHSAGEGTRDKLAKGSSDFGVKGARYIKTVGMDRLDTHQPIADVRVLIFESVGHGLNISQNPVAKVVLHHVVEAAVMHDDIGCLRRVVVLEAPVTEEFVVKAEGQLVDPTVQPTKGDGIGIHRMVAVHAELVDVITSQIDLAWDRVSWFYQ